MADPSIRDDCAGEAGGYKRNAPGADNRAGGVWGLAGPARYSTIARMSSSVMMRYSSPSMVTSLPA